MAGRRQQWSDIHRMFLQVMMSRRVLSVQELRKVYGKLEPDESVRNLTTFLATVNENLEPLSMSIVEGKEEDTGRSYYALANTSPDAAAKLASDFTPAELEFFRKVVEMLVNSDTGSTESISLMNISIERKLSKTDVQTLLKRLTKEKWLTFIEDTGHYAPGVRFILELRPFLRETFGDDDVFKCPVCSSLVIRGEVCTGCSARIHLYCAEKLFNERTTATCPNCRSQLHRQQNVSSSRKRSTRESLSDNAYLEEAGDYDALAPSGSGLSQYELKQAVLRASQHKHARR
ncbi:non-structural maintenance of chromosomes element 1 homolog [Dysidea avara]|uniref:non-structural maintenance of chromosomes element 1 homolog n=1 Tax=Dysidea avara TaxID=196820 RepID=UPI00331A7793